jgi:hypothetical protein
MLGAFGGFLGRLGPLFFPLSLRGSSRGEDAAGIAFLAFFFVEEHLVEVLVRETLIWIAACPSRTVRSRSRPSTLYCTPM